MIVSVGGTPSPIVTSISAHLPEFVSFLASQASSDNVSVVKSALAEKGVTVTSEMTLVDDPDDLFHCFGRAESAVERVLVRGYQRSEVIADYTGGTKNMSVALSLAAIVHGFLFAYVGGTERTRGGLGVVIEGKERVYRSENPWDYLAIEERRKTATLFNQYQFRAAKSIVDRLIEKGIKNAWMFRKVSDAFEGFHLWDLFRHKQAADAFKKARLNELVDSDDKMMRRFAEDSLKVVPFLEALVAEHRCSRLHIHDLHWNAERRFEEGKVDDAILRLYRVVEMGAQVTLYQTYGIDTSDVQAAHIPAALREQFVKEYRGTRDGRIKIPQAASYELLAELGDPLGEKFKEHDKRFQDLQMSRNTSYLAHGFGSSKESTYIALREFVESLGFLRTGEKIVFPKMRE